MPTHITDKEIKKEKTNQGVIINCHIGFRGSVVCHLDFSLLSLLFQHNLHDMGLMMYTYMHHKPRNACIYRTVKMRVNSRYKPTYHKSLHIF